MSNVCKGLCSREDTIPIVFGQPLYQEGIKFCKRCDKFMKLDGYRCPCCKGNARSRSHRYKSRLLIAQTA
jgi:predicted amidophosphoribosyltransferase